MGGGVGILSVGEDFLVEFLARTESGVFDLDILADLEAGQRDHPPGEVVDLDGFAHVEGEYLVALGQCHGFHDEAAGLGNGHEVAGDAGVSDRDGAAFLDLFAETRDDGAVGSEDIAEARGDELGLALDLAGLEGEAEGLHVDLCETLGAAHDVGGIDGLVGGDHDHLLDTVLDAFVGDVAGAVDIDEDSLAGVLLHQGDVLVRRGVEDYLRVPLAEDIVQPRRLAHVADHRDEVKLREAAFQLQAEVVHRSLGIVVENELLDAECGQLAAELAADRSGRAGHHDDLAFAFGLDVVDAQPDLLAAEKVLDLDAADLVLHDAPAGDLIYGRCEQDLDAVLGAETDESVLFQFGIGLSGKEDAVEREAVDESLELGVAVVAVDMCFIDLVLRGQGMRDEITHHLIMRGILEARDDGYGFLARPVHEDALEAVLRPQLALVPVIHEDHREPEGDE